MTDWKDLSRIQLYNTFLRFVYRLTTVYWQWITETINCVYLNQQILVSLWAVITPYYCHKLRSTTAWDDEIHQTHEPACSYNKVLSFVVRSVYFANITINKNPSHSIVEWWNRITQGTNYAVHNGLEETCLTALCEVEGSHPTMGNCVLIVKSTAMYRKYSKHTM